MDSSIRKNNYNREIYVMELDGSVRSASWEERRQLTRNQNVPKTSLQVS